TLEADACQHTPVAQVLGDEDLAVVHERVPGVALLDQQTKAVTGARVGGEVEVRGKDLDQLHHQLRRLAERLHRLEQGTAHLAAHGLHTNVRPRVSAPHLPAVL